MEKMDVVRDDAPVVGHDVRSLARDEHVRALADLPQPAFIDLPRPGELVQETVHVSHGFAELDRVEVGGVEPDIVHAALLSRG
jgi:hypothetical protein